MGKWPRPLPIWIKNWGLCCVRVCARLFFTFFFFTFCFLAFVRLVRSCVYIFIHLPWCRAEIISSILHCIVCSASGGGELAAVGHTVAGTNIKQYINKIQANGACVTSNFSSRLFNSSNREKKRCWCVATYAYVCVQVCLCTSLSICAMCDVRGWDSDMVGRARETDGTRIWIDTRSHANIESEDKKRFPLFHIQYIENTQAYGEW